VAASFALTIAGTVFQNLAYDKLDKALSGEGFSDADIISAIAGTQSAIFQRGSDEVRDAAVTAVIEAISNVYILTIVAGAVIFAGGFSMRWEKLFMKNGTTE